MTERLFDTFLLTRYSNNDGFIRSTELYEDTMQKRSICICTFDQGQFTPTLFNEFSIQLPDSIERAVVKRKSEFLAGRYATKLAMASFEIDNQQITIGNNRQPIWPDGFVGSITHCDNMAVAIVGIDEAPLTLGVDVESILTKDTIDEIISAVLNVQEVNLLSLLNTSFEAAFTLCFSAKESVFKAFYPLVQEYFDFDALIISDICLKTNTILAHFSRCLSSTISIGDSVLIRFSLLNQKALTLCIGTARSL